MIWNRAIKFLYYLYSSCKGPSTLATLFNHLWPRIVAGIFIPVGNHYFQALASTLQFVAQVCDRLWLVPATDRAFAYITYMSPPHVALVCPPQCAATCGWTKWSVCSGPNSSTTASYSGKLQWQATVASYSGKLQWQATRQRVDATVKGFSEKTDRVATVKVILNILNLNVLWIHPNEVITLLHQANNIMKKLSHTHF